VVPGRSREAPLVPTEIRDAVEKWARGCGRHADIVYVPTNPPIPQVRLELRSDDPRLRAWQEGRADEKPVETVELVKWDGEKKRYVALNLMDLGASGVVELLEKGNMHSGRGDFGSLQEAIVAVRQDKETKLERLKNWLRGEAIARVEDRSYGDRSTAPMFVVGRDMNGGDEPPNKERT
jgi:hypothetical protein